ncbi:MAG: PLP-dependent transferase [Candidatus Didemnitutus sp.]|nr:PLP-dependent transferase [Candidatus Didemnitutus sp.]
MSVLFSPPLGHPIPGSPHSVSCSLPTMADVIGYEERAAAVVHAMTAGYPRFAVHPFVAELTTHLTTALAQSNEHLWPVLNARAARELIRHLGTGRSLTHAGVEVVLHGAEPALITAGKLWLQHRGGLLSSRAAEDALVRLGRRTAVLPENVFDGDATAEVQRVLSRHFPVAPTEIHLASSGMSAMQAAFEAIRAVQAPRGRTVWIQLGWLYLDTIALLKKFTPDPTRDYLVQHDVTDLAALERLFAAHGERLAGVITEAPTNPLLHTADLAAIADLAQRHGVRVICDPSIASPLNVEVLPHADIVACSLTKYVSPEGDVMAGAAVVNPRGPDAAALAAAVPTLLDPPYPRDLARLAAEIGSAEEVVARINANTPAVVAFLQKHPSVARVWWSHQAATAENFRRIARSPASVGAVVSFTLHGKLAGFYDRVAVAKGPSFGMATTLLCPYIYLAHYDLLPHRSTSTALADAGIPPELLRLSVGAEPVEDIIATLAAALA